jgi:two-component system, NarL family, nitrate/nitrite sensor histidine kinase NarX
MTTSPNTLHHAVRTHRNRRNRDPATANQELKCLYDIEKRFSAEPTAASSYQFALRKIEHLLGFSSAAICLSSAGQQTAMMLASMPTESSARLAFCQTRNCRACMRGRNLHTSPDVGGMSVLRVPLLTSKSRYGVISFRLPKGSVLNPGQRKILRTLGTRMAMFAETAELRGDSERRALQEERLAMARDIHDSLAHTLAYLKIQLLRLRNQLGKHERDVDLDKVVEELATGLTDANTQVRELISTFRLRLPHGGFESAVAQVAGQCAARSKMHVQVHNAVPASLLTAHEQINLVHILKESLINAERHASAGCIWIRLYLRDDIMLVMEIEDDGIGIPACKAVGRRNQRYGIEIIRERARLLRGKIRIASRTPSGTIVMLAFMPESCKKPQIS